MVNVIGELLPVAMAVALSPFPIVAIAVILGSPDGRGAGVAFALGWAVGLTALTAIAVLAVGEAEATSRGIDAWLQIALGLALIAAAARKWRRRPRAGREPKVPGWIASLDGIAPAKALVVGLGLGAINPKNLALAFAAGATIVELAPGRRDALAGIAVFALLGSVTVLGAVAARLLGGQRTARRLEAVKQFMLANNAVIVMIVFVLIGMKVLGDGLAALG